MRFGLLVLLAACSGPSERRGLAVPHAMPVATLTDIAPEALPLVNAWADAIGGREAIAAIDAVHSRGTYEKGGLAGTIDLWETASGQRREEIELGFLRYVRVLDDGHGWLVDRNREVRALAGWELADQLALAFWGAQAALVLDREPGSVTRDGDALVLSPSGGTRPERVTFDRVTGLPAARVRRDGEKLRRTTMSDWRVVDGVKRPFTLEESTDNPRDHVVIHWTSIERAQPPEGAFARPVDREPDMELAASPAVVPIEVVFGGLVFAQVSINGVPMSFIVDSGAEATVLNESRVAKLGLTAVGSFATGAGGGDVVLSFVRGVTTQVGDAKVRDQIVAVVPLDHLETPLQRPLDGILGYDFLSRFVVEIDYAHETMRLYDRAAYRHAGTSKPIDVTLEDGTPFLDASIMLVAKGGVTHVQGHFVLDTGCLCDVQLFTPFVDKNRLLDFVPGAFEQGFSAGAGGATHEVSATIPGISIGRTTILDVRADFSRDHQGANADPESAGLIGSVTWKRFVLVLDYKHQRVYLDSPAP